MALLNGYNLLSKAGRQPLKQVLAGHRPYLAVVAFDCRIWLPLTNLSPEQAWDELRRGVGRRALHLVRWICREQDRAGRYYLVENPCGSAAWVFEGILGKLLEQAHGKFLYGDQCRFGKRDSESKRPVRKRTGWLSNSESILNQLGKQCVCPPGAHDIPRHFAGQCQGRRTGGGRMEARGWRSTSPASPSSPAAALLAFVFDRSTMPAGFFAEQAADNDGVARRHPAARACRQLARGILESARHFDGPFVDRNYGVPAADGGHGFGGGNPTAAPATTTTRSTWALRWVSRPLRFGSLPGGPLERLRAITRGTSE